MKKYLCLIVFLGAISLAHAQDTKKVFRIHATINNQHPDKFLQEDKDYKITLNKFTAQTFEFSIYNKSEEPAYIFWNESYFVIDGKTEPLDNYGVSKIAIGVIATTQVDNMKSQKIGGKSAFIAKARSKGYPFGEIAAKKHFKNTGEILVNRIVFALKKGDEIKEYPITIELYPRESLKQ